MESTNNTNELRLCNICKAFYGSQNTNFLCSKCFKDQQESEKQNSATASPVKQLVQEVADAVSPSMQLPQQQPTESKEEMKEPAQPGLNAELTSQANVEMKTEETKEEVKAEEPKVQTNTNKCWMCSRKVGLVQTACKCGYVYCPKHRHSEAHNCTYDYHQQQKDLLTKNNPQIMHKKMEKMF